jgi:lipoate-protein ligase B
MTNNPAYLLNLAETPYPEAYALQTAANAARHTGRLDRDLVILLEHPPVFTLGRRGGRENLIVPEETLRTRGIEIVPVERGGDITYHGPGQLVVYLIMDLKSGRWAVVEFVSGLENAMVRTASQWGISAAGNDELRGAWIGGRKLGSVGITVRRGVTFHGLALNVNTDLEPFTWINPCGIQGCTMTSLAREIGRAVDMNQVRRQMTENLSRQFGLLFEELDRKTAETLFLGDPT